MAVSITFETQLLVDFQVPKESYVRMRKLLDENKFSYTEQELINTTCFSVKCKNVKRAGVLHQLVMHEQRRRNNPE